MNVVTVVCLMDIFIQMNMRICTRGIRANRLIFLREVDTLGKIKDSWILHNVCTTKIYNEDGNLISTQMGINNSFREFEKFQKEILISPKERYRRIK